MATWKGGNAQLLLQRMASTRVAPTPAAYKMRFSEVELSDGDENPADPSITGRALQGKADCGDQAWTGSLTSILCLNNIGQWLTLLWGTPVTTGAGPYTHVWTLDLADRPFALLELGYTDATLYRRWLDVFVSTLSWNVVEKEQNMTIGLLPSVEVEPRPSAAFDSAPIAYAKNRACPIAGTVYDVSGASTLGRVTSCSVEISNDMEGQPYADGLAGYGDALVGQPTISGSLAGVFGSDSQILTYQEARTSVPMTLVSKNDAGDASLTLALPAVEFGKAKHAVNTSKGLTLEASWRAHDDPVAPTITVVNGISSY